MFGVEPLTAAYGRTYKALAEAQKDFDLNKDFKTPSGSYTSKQEVKQMFPQASSISLRYGNSLTKKGVLELC